MKKSTFIHAVMMACLLACTHPADTAPDTNDIILGLPWSFIVSDSPKSPVQLPTESLVADARNLESTSVETEMPLQSLGDKPLRLDYTTAHYQGGQTATSKFDYLAGLDAESGLDAGWNMLLLRADKLHWLRAQCGIGKDHYRKLYRNFLEHVASSTNGDPSRVLLCGCGEGCREVMFNQ